MKKTRIISFRSDEKIDKILKELTKYENYLSHQGGTSESIIIRSAIYWYYDEIKKQYKLLKAEDHSAII